MRKAKYRGPRIELQALELITWRLHSLEALAHLGQLEKALASMAPTPEGPLAVAR